MPELDTDPDQGRARTRTPRGRETDRILAAEQLFELRALRQTMTEQAAHLAGRAVNNTLATGTAVFPTVDGPGGLVGQVAMEFAIAAGSIRIVNLSAAGAVTVHSSGPQGYAPAAGTGVYVVPAGIRDTVPLASRQVTLYGTAGERVSYIVFTGAVEPTT